jgi:hypothetical protein
VEHLPCELNLPVPPIDDVNRDLPKGQHAEGDGGIAAMVGISVRRDLMVCHLKVTPPSEDDPG